MAYVVDPEAAMDMRTRVLLWRTEILLRRENRRRRRVLRCELAAYTATELVDLECAIERYPLGRTQELRSMLASQRLQAAWSPRSRVA